MSFGVDRGASNPHRGERFAPMEKNMLMSVEEAERQGASAGLLGEGTPGGFDNWPSSAKATFFEAFNKGMDVRNRAVAYEKKEAAASTTVVNTTPYAGMTREQLTAAYDRDPRIRAEFITAERFIAYSTAESAGKIRVTRGVVVSRS